MGSVTLGELEVGPVLIGDVELRVIGEAIVHARAVDVAVVGAWDNQAELFGSRRLASGWELEKQRQSSPAHRGQ